MMRRLAIAAGLLVLLAACEQEAYTPGAPPRPPDMAPTMERPEPPRTAPTWFPADCVVQPPDEYAGHLVGASRRHRIEACHLARQTNAESAFNPAARSPAGAVGISQFVPETAAEWGIDPLDPEEAIYGQARYLRWCRNRWDPDLPGRGPVDISALGLYCYNAGVGNAYASQRRHGWVTWAQARPHAPAETQGYIHKIMGE